LISAPDPWYRSDFACIAALVSGGLLLALVVSGCTLKEDALKGQRYQDLLAKGAPICVPQAS
jgi:hypothetical protein